MNADVLIVGGGLAGIRTAIELAQRDVTVILIERSAALGGRLACLGMIFPSNLPGSVVANIFIARLEGQVEKGLVQVLTEHEVKRLDKVGDTYNVIITGKEGEVTASVKAVVLAMGMEPIDAGAIPEFGYGLYDDVVTSVEMEELLPPGGGILRPSDGNQPRSVVFIQCVGSRVERRGVRYCSNICCLNAIKNASIIKRAHPEIDVYVLYIDIRTNGKGYEAAYKEARRLGVKFIRGQPSLVRPEGDKLLVCGENTIMRELYEVEADLVVLSVGLRTAPENVTLAESMGQSFDADMEIVTQADGSHLSGGGIFIAGSLEHPKDIHDTIQSAKACALTVLGYVRR